ncbi:hypothetical protein [Paraburkholderia phenazinium]|uniref:hypothetical protein n=1 Tax=Paraburkholderia phenazinium TaxID=60549 RepID=UPI00158BDD98|nr:hypothetical protein [Paraburkholderia phenazinium]
MYNHFINTFIDAQTAAWRHYSAVAGTEERLFGRRGASAVRVPTTAEITAELRRVYTALAQRMVERVRTQFACGGARPVVNLASVAKRAGFDIERSLARGDVPDFDRLWLVMEAQLGTIGAPAGAGK